MSDELTVREARLRNLGRMRSEFGRDPFLVEQYPRDLSANDLIARYEKNKVFHFAGRVVSYRVMGKAGFAHLSDGEGRIQCYFRRDALGEEAWNLFNLLDIGDHVGLVGFLFTTRTGERSIHVLGFTPLSKALQPLPIGKEKEGHVFSGLSDVEIRYRHRHLDLIANRGARQSLLLRSKIVTAVRRYFEAASFVEVETPILQIEAGGAAARPFQTHYNAYEMDVKLRISLELYLKRLICGDIPKVYEIGRVFRNEGVSSRHNPEFTMLEFYEAFVDLEAMMQRVEDLFRFVAREVFGTTLVVPGFSGAPSPIPRHPLQFVGPFLKIGASDTYLLAPFKSARGAPELPPEVAHPGVPISLGFPEISIVLLSGGPIEVYETARGIFLHTRSQSQILFEDTVTVLRRGWWLPLKKEPFSGKLGAAAMDFSHRWRRVQLMEEIERLTGLSSKDLSSIEAAQRALGATEVLNPATGKRITPDEEQNLGGLIEKLLEVFVEPTLQEPTFVVGYPIETSPLAKKDPANPRFTRRFEGYIRGKEICNAFSEINDPIDQRERFAQQVEERAKGDEEAHPMDEEFLFALECGMPPTGGCGIGIDRMAMMLTGADHIREVLLFPFMRPESGGSGERISG